LAEAINVLENKITSVEDKLGKVQGKETLQQAVSVWNNLRFHAMRKLDEKSFSRFYYDTKTFENFLDIILNKLEDQYDFGTRKLDEEKKRYLLQAGVFQVNIGYMTRKHPISKSMEKIWEESIQNVEDLLGYAKRMGYFSRSKYPDILSEILNDWLYLKYNMSNVFFPADKTIFSVTNSIYKRVVLLNKKIAEG
jgi:hypothetical protein